MRDGRGAGGESQARNRADSESNRARWRRGLTRRRRSPIARDFSFASAADLPALFGDFMGTMRLSDFLGAGDRGRGQGQEHKGAGKERREEAGHRAHCSGKVARDVWSSLWFAFVHNGGK